jgi:hypothetical protein
MSANPEVLQTSEMIGPAIEGEASRAARAVVDARSWNPEEFAREQIRSLVRRVFFNGDARPIKQVAFSAAGPNVDVAAICDQVGQALSLETSSDVAVLTRPPAEKDVVRFPGHGYGALKSSATRLGGNLWFVPECGTRQQDPHSGIGRYWRSRLAELRSEFEYSVIHGPVAAISSEAAILGELTDGIVLVLGANSTRKASVRKVKESLQTGGSRILGTVLSGRLFPMPERIYRNL